MNAELGSRATDPYEAEFAGRARAYLEAVIAGGASRDDPADGIFQLVPSEVFRLIPPLELGRGPVDMSPLPDALRRIAERRDCADFVLAGLQRILLRYADSPLLTAEACEAMSEAIRKFCYWYDQPGIAGMCFHTENHQILFHACEILAGQMLRGHAFANSGMTGLEHVAAGTARALRWIDERARFGFVEWLSCYFEEDLLALLNLYDFAGDAEIRRRAGMLVDMILFEIALYGHHGVLGTTHGRTYAEYIKGGRLDPVSAIAYLVFGEGVASDRPNLALTALSTSRYRCPTPIRAIAADRSGEMVCRARCGLSMDEARRWGIRPDALEDQMFFWACQTARHPAARGASRQMTEAAKDPWLLAFVDSADKALETTRMLVESGGAAFDADAVNTALSPADLYVFKTTEYVLSCAQDFRPGRPGYQQHLWQATLDIDAVVFTNHPGSAGESSAHTARPNFWAGNRFLPRVGQWRNVLIAIHHVAADDPLPYSHAYFPQTAFDEVRSEGNWVFGRKGDAYIALYSRHVARWIDGAELRAETADNIWICEMGAVAQWGTFDAFAAAIGAAPVHGEGLAVVYRSPSAGEVWFGWVGDLSVNGEPAGMHHYPRYDNPFCKAALGDREFTVRLGEDILEWDFATP